LGKIIVNLLESCLPPSSFEDAVDASVSGDQGLAAAFVQGLGEAVIVRGPSSTPEEPGQQKLFSTRPLSWDTVMDVFYNSPDFETEYSISRGEASQRSAMQFNDKRDRSNITAYSGRGVAMIEWIFYEPPTPQGIQRKLEPFRQAGFKTDEAHLYERRGHHMPYWSIRLWYRPEMNEAVHVRGPSTPRGEPGQQKLFAVNLSLEEVSDLLAQHFNRHPSGSVGTLKVTTFSDPESVGQFILRLNYARPYFKYPRLEPVASMYAPAPARRMDQTAFADALQYLSDNKIPWHLVRGENYAIIGEEKPYMEQPSRSAR